MADAQAAKIVFQMETTGTAAVLKNFDQIKNILENLNKTQTFENISKKISQTGRNMQWLGQRLTYGLSLPLALFGNQAINTFLEVDKAYTSLERVWDGNAKQLERLKDIGEKLSNTYAIAQTNVAGIFTEFSKAGLGKTTEEMERLAELALKTSSIFDVDIDTSISQVKALMLAYGQTVDEAAASIDTMNVIADNTAATEKGLIEALTRAGEVAKPINFGVRELSASMAVLESANVGTERASTGLRTILTKLVTSSDKAKDSINVFGINMNSANWKTLTGQERLDVLAKKFTELKKSGDKVKFEDFRSALSILVGGGKGGYVNELYLLLEDIGESFDSSTASSSEFAKAMQASIDPIKNAETTAKQLETTFSSEAFKTEQLKTKYQNLQKEIGEKLLPIKVKLYDIATKLIEKFNSLSPKVQENIVKFGTLILVLGPILSVFGSVLQIIGLVASAFSKIISVVKFANYIFSMLAITTKLSLLANLFELGAFLTGPFGLALAGVIAVIGSVIWWFNKKKESIDKTKDSIKSLKYAEKEYTDAQSTYDKANLTLLQNQQRVSDLTAEISQLQKDGETETLNYKIKIAELAIANNDVAESQRNIILAKSDLDTALSNVTRVDTFSKSVSALKKTSDEASVSLQTMLDKGASAESKSAALQGFPRNVILRKHLGGLIHAANGAIIPGHSPLRDRVPVMAEQGEGIMSRSAIENFLKTGMTKGESTVYNINFNPGVMIATPGEQRNFARQIKKLIEQDNARYAQPGPIFRGLTA